MAYKLNAVSEPVLHEISAIITRINSEAVGTHHKDNDNILSNTEGEITYGGRLLARKVSELMRKMHIAEGSQFTVTKFLKTTVISNNTTRYLVVVSEKATLTPGGEIPYGHYTIIEGATVENDDEIILDPGATIIFIKPK